MNFQSGSKVNCWRPPGTKSSTETEIPPTFPPTHLTGPPGTTQNDPGQPFPRRIRSKTISSRDDFRVLSQIPTQPSRTSKKDPLGASHSQRSKPSSSRPIHPPPDALLRGVGEPSDEVVRTVPCSVANKQQKRRQGMPPTPRGQTRRKHWGHQRHHPLQAVNGAVGAVYELPKKRRVPNPSPYDASSPHRRELLKNDGRNTYESSPSQQNVAGVRQPRKRRVP